jgi:hypothetical protein
MSDGLLKPEKDFSKDADKLIPESEQLAKVQIAYLGIFIHHAVLTALSDRCSRSD